MGDILYRDRSKGIVGGVCAGLADYFAVGPLLLRVIFILWALVSGTGVAAYAILWTVLPQKRVMGLSQGEVVRRNFAAIQAEAREWIQDVRELFGGKAATPTPGVGRATVLGGALMLLSLGLLVDGLGLLGPFRVDHLWPFALILMGFVALNRALRM
jgi:phage shock protein PspC (stress-responsive transcriptional regulator)